MEFILFQLLNLIYIVTRDEFYVSNKKAKEGVLIKNESPVEPLVILKHFGPDVGIPEKPAKK